MIFRVSVCWCHHLLIFLFKSLPCIRFSSLLLVMFTVHLPDTFQETTKQFLQTRSILVITFYRDQAAQLQKAAELASLAYNTNDSNLRIVTVDAAQGRWLHACCHKFILRGLIFLQSTAIISAIEYSYPHHTLCCLQNHTKPQFNIWLSVPLSLHTDP